MAFYDRIAKKWHAITGSQGGPLKKLVLNDSILNRIDEIAGRSILELGAGNGYFLPLLLRRFSGQVPGRIVITDLSPVLLNLAQRHFRVPDAEYRILDVRSHYPFEEGSVDLLVANMVFNEVKTVGLQRAAAECFRVLSTGGRLIGTITHPAFVDSLAARTLLKRSAGGSVTMPGAEGLRLPVVRRSLPEFLSIFEDAGFRCVTEDIFATPEVHNLKPGLKKVRDLPIALLFQATKGGPPESELTRADETLTAVPRQETVGFDQSLLRSGTSLHAGREVLPGYVLTERLGKGGFGEVWKAIGPGAVPVALKVICLEERLAAVEARALDFMKLVRHPHLLATFGIWHDEGRMIIGTELAEGSLMDRWREAQDRGLPGIEVTRLLEFLHDAAKGIDFLNEPRHTLNGDERVRIVHRDIKPHNLLLVGGAVKVADFGLARIIERSTSGSTKGAMTPAYAAPELFNGCVTQNSDQYSLAVSYCQLRGGRLPFMGTFHQVVAGHLYREPDLSMLPPEEQPSVARALAKSPEARWPNCQSFVKALSETRPS